MIRDKISHNLFSAEDSAVYSAQISFRCEYRDLRCKTSAEDALLSMIYGDIELELLKILGGPAYAIGESIQALIDRLHA